MRAKKSVLRKLRQISPAEFAVLEMTNDPKAKSKVSHTESETVTSKEAYVWAALMAHVAQNEPGIGADEIVRAALGRSRRQIKDYYRNFPYYVFGTETQTFSQQISPRYMALVLLGFSWAEPITAHSFADYLTEIKPRSARPPRSANSPSADSRPRQLAASPGVHRRTPQNSGSHAH